MRLNAKEALDNAEAAFKAGKLQMQHPNFVAEYGCSYQGPCAIGISVPSELAEEWDGPPGASIPVWILLDNGELETDFPEILETLQEAHDHAALNERTFTYLRERLQQLEAGA